MRRLDASQSVEIVQGKSQIRERREYFLFGGGELVLGFSFQFPEK
jgi:hypothetical protein